MDIYRAVWKAPSSTVLDVSIYSHCFIEGPVLADTTDEERKAPTGEPIRTPSDLDGRARSDFTPHMGEEDVKANKDALEKFRGAFARGAHFRIVGCYVQAVVDGRPFERGKRSFLRSTALQVIRTVYEDTKAAKELRANKKAASVTLDMELEFKKGDKDNNNPRSHFTNFTGAQLKVLHYGLDPLFFSNKNTGALKFDKRFTEVIKFIARQMKLGCVFKAAEALPAVTCLGAVPGCGGEFEEGGHGLMHVPERTYHRPLRFYETLWASCSTNGGTASSMQPALRPSTTANSTVRAAHGEETGTLEWIAEGLANALTASRKSRSRPTWRCC